MRDGNRRTVRDLRRGNRSVVLRRLYFDGPLSRQELGPATGLSSGSISNVVGDLMADGLLEEAGVVDSDGGRPRTLLRVAADSGHVIGIDVGENRVRVELFDLALAEVVRADRPLAGGRRDPDHVIARLSAAFADVLAASGISAEDLLGVGVGVPGIVATGDPRGAIVHGQTFGWEALPFESMTRSALGLPEDVPLVVDNGARTLGQAEMWFGRGRGETDVAVVLMGSGLGASVFAGGAPTPTAEWGHTTSRVGGRRCRCGGDGCLEAYVGAEAMVGRWREAGGDVAADADEETAFGALIAAAERAGDHGSDAAAASTLAEAVEYLGAGIADLVNLFNPQCVVIGGWAGLQLGESWLATLRGHVARYALRYPASRVVVERGRLGPDAVTVGAATLPVAEFLADGGRRSPSRGRGQVG